MFVPFNNRAGVKKNTGRNNEATGKFTVNPAT